MVSRLISIPIALAAVACAASGALAASTHEPAARSCFASNDWSGWSASADGDALYLRVRTRDIYRVDLSPGSHVRKYGDEFLVNRVRGSNWICSPLDLDLTLRDHSGLRQPLFPRGLHKLDPAEIAAIPRKELP